MVNVQHPIAYSAIQMSVCYKGSKVLSVPPGLGSAEQKQRHGLRRDPSKQSQRELELGANCQSSRLQHVSMEPIAAAGVRITAGTGFSTPHPGAEATLLSHDYLKLIPH